MRNSLLARTDICICICVPARTPYTLQHFNNLKAAFAYECPCGRQCLGRVKECHADDALTVLYDHRRLLRDKAKKGKGGLRDEVRRIYQEHFDGSTHIFTHNFVIGRVGDMCDRAFAVGSSLSEATYVRERCLRASL
eukprot:scaffold5183_cov153-Isochrysis_galbana.AAC.1